MAVDEVDARTVLTGLGFTEGEIDALLDDPDLLDQVGDAGAAMATKAKEAVAAGDVATAGHAAIDGLREMRTIAGLDPTAGKALPPPSQETDDMSDALEDIVSTVENAAKRARWGVPSGGRVALKQEDQVGVVDNVPADVTSAVSDALDVALEALTHPGPRREVQSFLRSVSTHLTAEGRTGEDAFEQVDAAIDALSDFDNGMAAGKSRSRRTDGRDAQGRSRKGADPGRAEKSTDTDSRRDALGRRMGRR